jgi:hypothetical protein
LLLRGSFSVRRSARGGCKAGGGRTFFARHGGRRTFFAWTPKKSEAAFASEMQAGADFISFVLGATGTFFAWTPKKSLFSAPKKPKKSAMGGGRTDGNRSAMGADELLNRSAMGADKLRSAPDEQSAVLVQWLQSVAATRKSRAAVVPLPSLGVVP